jgi:hypothetical protein
MIPTSRFGQKLFVPFDMSLRYTGGTVSPMEITMPPGGAVGGGATGVVSPRRRKAYLVATYTGTLEPPDLLEDWFVYDQDDGTHRSLAQEMDTTHEVLPVSLRPSAEALEAMSAEEQWEAKFTASQGYCTPTSPGTDASVHIELIGTVDGQKVSSKVHSLNHTGGGNETAGIFHAGSIDEFAISCEDLGDVHTLRIWHDNDGQDLQSSRWKLEKVGCCLRLVMMMWC